MFCKIPYKLEFLKKIPDEGQFATIIKQIPTSFHKDTGINILDRIFIYNEQMPESILCMFAKWLSKRKYTGKFCNSYIEVINYLKDLEYSIKEYEKLWDNFYNNSFINSFILQMNNVYDCHVKGNPSNIYRVIYPEINVQNKGEDFLKEAYDIVSFEYGIIENQDQIAPGIKGLVRDLVDALQIDGMDKREAMKYLLNNNILKKEENSILEDELGSTLKIKLPGYYYKLKKEYAQYF